MIVLSRSLARRFRAVLRRLLQDAEQRHLWPFLLCQADSRSVSLQARCGDLGVRYHQPGGQTPETLLLQSSLLAEIEGRTETPVELESVDAKKGKARFDDDGVPRILDFDLVNRDPADEWPSLLRKLAPQPPEFLTALHEAARTCAPASGRLALSRVQMRGKAGEVVATDGKQLLVQRGFTMPWSEDVLVPRLTAFTCREMDGGPIGLGRTDKHVVLRIGPWTFLLSIDATSRFPNVETVIPRANSVNSRWHLDEANAGHLINILPKLPGSDDAHAAVTLDLSQESMLRARGDDQEKVAELPLGGSTLSGSPVRFCVDRSFLRRALLLGFRELHVTAPDKPLAWHDTRRQYVVMTLELGSVIPPARDALRLSGPPMSASSSSPSSDERKNAIMPAPPNRPPDNNHGTTTGNGKGNDPAQPPRYGIDELIDDAEQLRASLHDASVRVSRLLAALKLQRRQTRALKSAVASLQQLQLGP